jgi:hypothetical protein
VKDLSLENGDQLEVKSSKRPNSATQPRRGAKASAENVLKILVILGALLKKLC